MQAAVVACRALSSRTEDARSGDGPDRGDLRQSPKAAEALKLLVQVSVATGSRALDFQLAHERREIGNFPMFSELLVRDSIELKGHRVHSVSSRLASGKRASVRSLDAIQDRDVISLCYHGRYR